LFWPQEPITIIAHVIVDIEIWAISCEDCYRSLWIWHLMVKICSSTKMPLLISW
jgi:hypothetical protein